MIISNPSSVTLFSLHHDSYHKIVCLHLQSFDNFPPFQVGLDAKLSCKQQSKIPPKTSQCKSTPDKHSQETSEDEVPNSSKTLSHTPSKTSHCKSNHSQCLTKTYEDELVEPSETSSRTSSKASVCEVITPDLYPEEAPEDKNVQSSKTLQCKRTPDHSPDKTCERKCWVSTFLQSTCKWPQ